MLSKDSFIHFQVENRQRFFSFLLFIHSIILLDILTRHLANIFLRENVMTTSYSVLCLFISENRLRGNWSINEGKLVFLTNGSYFVCDRGWERKKKRNSSSNKYIEQYINQTLEQYTPNVNSSTICRCN